MGGRPPPARPPPPPQPPGDPPSPDVLHGRRAQKHHDAGINVLNLATRTARAVRNLQPNFTRQAIRRGSFTSVKDLITAIETYIDGWNERCQPFTWTKTADEILTKATRGHRSSFTRH